MNEPDPQLFRETAIELGVDVSFVEKDWHATSILRVIAELPDSTFKPAFSGGTSLSKAHGLIQRFSEDIDFKVSKLTCFNSKAELRRSCKGYRDQVIEAIERAGWSVDNVFTANEHQFFSIPVDYNCQFEPAPLLRPHLKVELTIGGPALPTSNKSVQSFVAAYAKISPEVVAVACVDPAETAADKLSILTWRVLSRNRQLEADDPNLVRHLHDLAEIESLVLNSDEFVPLARETIEKDKGRGQTPIEVQELPAADRLSRAASILREDHEYLSEYDHFVMAMSYAPDDDRPEFEIAVQAYERICERITAS